MKKNSHTFRKNGISGGMLSSISVIQEQQASAEMRREEFDVFDAQKTYR